MLVERATCDMQSLGIGSHGIELDIQEWYIFHTLRTVIRLTLVQTIFIILARKARKGNKMWYYILVHQKQNVAQVVFFLLIMYPTQWSNYCFIFRNYCKMDTNETRQDHLQMLMRYLEAGINGQEMYTKCKKSNWWVNDVTLLLMHWSYIFLVLTHRNVIS